MESFVLSVMRAQRVIPVIRLGIADEARVVVDVLYEAGMRIIELTTSMPQVFHIGEELRAHYKDLIIGVGTLHTGEMARQAVESGAHFLVTYKVSESVAEEGLRAGIPFILGGATPTEISRCHDLGSMMVKVFPAGSLGVSFIRDLRGPLPDIKLMPTGGIHLDNAKSWLDAGALAVGMGGAIIPQAGSIDSSALKARVQNLFSTLSVSSSMIQKVVREREGNGHAFPS